MDFRTWGILTFILAGPTTFLVAVEFELNTHQMITNNTTYMQPAIVTALLIAGIWGAVAIGYIASYPQASTPPSAAHILFRFLALPFVLIGSAALMLVFPIVCALTIPF